MTRWSLLSLLLVASAAAAEPRLEEVQVVARRNLLGQAVSEGISVSQVRPQDQVSLNRSVADWIERLPGVSLNGQGGLLQSYSVRGFSRWRLRTELDGVPIITDRRAGNSASFLPPGLMGAATVQRGPASALYGSGAMGGVISLASVEGDGLALSASGQTGDEQRTLTGVAGNPGQYTAAFSYRRANESEDARGGPLDSDFEQLAAVFKYRTWLGSRELSASWIPSLGEDIGKSSAFFPDRRVSDYPQEQHSVSRVELRDGDAWLLQVYHHFQDWRSDTERLGERRNIADYRSHTLGGLFYSAWSWDGGDGRWGLEWLGRRDVTIDETVLDSSSTRVSRQRVLDGEQDNVAAFAEQNWHRGAWDLGAGLRYDHVDQTGNGESRNDSRLDFSLHASWSGLPDWTLSAELGTGFRFPSLSELYFDGTTPRGDITGNPQLDPERNRAMELAAAYHGPVAQLRANVYYNAVEDYIERYAVAPDALSYRNTERAHLYGYELAVSLPGPGRWHHEVSYQWQRGEDERGDWLADLNPPALRYLLRWRGERVDLGIDLTYRQSRDDAGPGELPLQSAWLWNASASRSLGGNWHIKLYLLNLLDEYYAGSADEDSAYQPGRSLGLRVQWTQP